MKYLLAITLFLSGFTFNAQTEFEELEFESKSISTPYKPKGKNYAFIRSKKGKGGLNKNSRADSITILPINEIVLVFTELDAADAAERDQANRERWENLMLTYPEYFENYPYYTNICQCKPGGDAETFKEVQGFYIYFDGDEPAVAEATPEPVQEVAATPERKKTAEEPVTAPKATKEKPRKVAEEATEPVAVNEPVKEKKPEKESRKKKEETVEEDMDAFPEMRAAKTPAPRKAGFTKPKRAKDPKACRPACYEGGDEDLYAFFRENIPLTKKQRRKAKNMVAMVKLQLNFDGSVKKAMVTGQNESFNTQVKGVLERMNLWNPTVKNGLTVKSEVKFNLRYDKESQSIKPFDLMVTPRLPVKCKCVSDEELFGS